jgi:hypothetical protein
VGNYRVAAQLVASRVVLSSTELVTGKMQGYTMSEQEVRFITSSVSNG